MRKEGTRHVYVVNPKGVELMRRYLDRFWNKALAAFKNFVEEEEDA
jgi:hypothetical protein